MPGAPTFLPTKSFGSLIETPLRATAAIAVGLLRVHGRGARDRDEIEAAVDRLQEHGRRRAADLDRIGHDRRRNVGVDPDQGHVGVEAVLGEDALIARDHGGGAVARRRAGDLELERVGERRRAEASAQGGGGGEQAKVRGWSSYSSPPGANGSARLLDYRQKVGSYILIGKRQGR